MNQINDIINGINGILFSNYTVYALLLTGVVFTVWSGFGQFRALTHGVSVVRGKYDDKNDPGAINHFQALSAALSATVGLGNIAGVAVAVALGGPGAIFWMWIIGFLGMALKMTEVTQSMLYRNTEVGAGTDRDHHRRSLCRHAHHLGDHRRQHVPGLERRRHHQDILRY